MKKITFLTALFLAGITCTQAQTITTVVGNGYNAGNSLGGYSGDGGQATAAEMYAPYDAVFDASGNMYIADGLNNVIRKVNTSGIITTIAGTSVQGYSGDGGQASAAELSIPYGVAVDASGNIYITDTYNNVIRKVNTSGVISTIAGTSVIGYSGDGGQATDAELYNPIGITIDASNNIYFSDDGNNVVRKIDGSGIITTIVGNGGVGWKGDGGQATAAELQGPMGVSFDASGNFYVADAFNHVVRKVNTSGVISTVAGKGGVAGYTGDGGQATAAEIYNPFGVGFDASGNMYIPDAYYGIRVVNSSGIINTAAGTHIVGYSGDGGPATAAEMYQPTCATFDAAGNLYTTDAGNNVVRKIGLVVTGTATPAQLTGSVSIYPNPSHGKFIIQSSVNSGQLSVEVYNMLGEKVFSQYTPFTYQFSVDLTGRPSGVYLYRITSSEGAIVSTGKLIVE